MLSINPTPAQGYCREGANILAASVYFEVSSTDAYETAPTVAFTGGGGTGAAATANAAYGSVGSVNVTNGGSGYTSAPTVAFSGGGGANAAGTATLSDTASIKSLALTTGGTGYTNGTHNLVFTGGGGTGATGTATVSGGIVTGVSLTAGGSGYTSAPGVSLAPSAGAGNGAFAATPTMGHSISGVTVTNGGGIVITFTDQSVYDTGDSADVMNVSVFDRYGNHFEKQITGGTADLSLAGLNPFMGIDVIVTVVSTNRNRKDGSMHDIFTLHQTGYIDMEK